MNGMKPVVCCLLAGLVTAAAGSGATKPVKHFAVVFSGSGSYTVDFGEDRFEELRKKPTSGGGVDGKASITWSWTLKTVASRTGDKPVGHDRAVLQASYDRRGGRFLVYSFNGRRELSERPIECNFGGNYRTFDGEDRAAFRGDWVKWNPGLEYDRDDVSFSARIPQSLAPPNLACYHTTSEGVSKSGASDAYVPSTVSYPESAFNSRVGKSYAKTRKGSINLPRSHAFDVPQAHTVSGEWQETISITRISDETWRKRVKEYRESPKFGVSND